MLPNSFRLGAPEFLPLGWVLPNSFRLGAPEFLPHDYAHREKRKPCSCSCSIIPPATVIFTRCCLLLSMVLLLSCSLLPLFSAVHICKALERTCVALAATALLTNPMLCYVNYFAPIRMPNYFAIWYNTSLSFTVHPDLLPQML